MITPQEIEDLLPIPIGSRQFLSGIRSQIKDILTQKDERKLFIIGPCSIHNVEQSFEYASRLKTLAESVKEKIVIVMRAHVEKPRTRLGWKGLIYDPKLDGSNDIQLGLLKARRFMLEMAQLKLPISTEILDPYIYTYYYDLLSYAVIGARTSSSQTHRQIASQLHIPVGLKNSTDGNIDTAINAILFARTPQTFIAPQLNGTLAPTETFGNPLSHLILRGAPGQPNFDTSHIKQSEEKLKKHDIVLPLIVDCSHGNRVDGSQIPAFEKTVTEMAKPNSPIAGLMLESYLKEGRYRADQWAPGDISITDPCISIEQTEKLIIDAYVALCQAPSMV